MKRYIISLFLLSFFLTGCIETEEIEKVGLINARGVDIGENELLATTLIVFQFSAQTEENTKIIPGRGKTIKGAMEDAENASVFKLAPGKNKITLFGRETAEQGILPLLDTEARDARIPDLMYLAVSDTTAKEALTINEKNIPVDIGQFLRELIENHSRDHNIPRKTLQDFLRIYYDVGQDNVLPIFDIKGGVPNQRAIAVLQGDKYIGEITNEEAVYINMVNKKVKEQVLPIAIPLEPFQEDIEKGMDNYSGDKLHLALEIEKAKSKIKVMDSKNLTFQTNTNIRLRLVEQSAGVLIKNEKIVEKLEKEIE